MEQQNVIGTKSYSSRLAKLCWQSLYCIYKVQPIQIMVVVGWRRVRVRSVLIILLLPIHYVALHTCYLQMLMSYT